MVPIVDDEDAVVARRDADVAATTDEHIDPLGYIDDLDLHVIEVLLSPRGRGCAGKKQEGEEERA